MFELPDQRHSAILQRLTIDGRVVAGDLARAFGTSEDTIRRDLRDLAAAGLCRRVYGGALPVSPASGSVRQRLAEDPDVKAALGRAAAKLVAPGQTVMVDTGSTNLCIARELPTDQALTVVTNSPAIAAELGGRSGFEVVMIGGRIDARSGGSHGPKACAEIADVFPDIVFLGSCAVGPSGLAAFDADEAAFKGLLVRNAAKAVTAVANGKLGTMAPFGFAPLDRLDAIIVEADAPEALLGSLAFPRDRIVRASASKKGRQA